MILQYTKPFGKLFMGLLSFSVIFLALAQISYAQSAADISNAAQQSEQIQREQQLRRNDDINRSLARRRPAAKIVAPIPQVPHGKGSGCRNIKTINLTGANYLSTFKRKELTQKYTNRCLGVNEIQSLLGDITKYYIDNGYATTRTYLPSQDLTKGILTIKVVEGKVSDIRFKKGSSGANLAGAFPGVKGDELNLRDIEQGLDQINRLLSNNASMDIAPGKNVGESDIVVKNEPAKRWHVNATADDYGTKTTGRNQVSATGSLDNLLGLNEFYSITNRKSVPLNHDRKQASSTSFVFSVPYGYTTVYAGYSISDYDSTLSTPGGTELHLDGDNDAGFVTLDQMVYRSQESKVDLTATMTRKQAKNFIGGQELVVSSRTLTILDLGANFNTSLKGGFFNLAGGYSQGLKYFGALDDMPNLLGSDPRAQFRKLTMSASYTRPFAVRDENFLLASQVTGQYALDTLYGSEQISVGSIYSVRGFYNESLANDHGYFVRNDVTWIKNLGAYNGQNLVFKPYVALDGGTTGGRAPKSPNGSLVGAAAGFGLAYGPAYFDIFSGKPLVKPDSINEGGFNTFARLSVNF